MVRIYITNTRIHIILLNRKKTEARIALVEPFHLAYCVNLKWNEL